MNKTQFAGAATLAAAQVQEMLDRKSKWIMDLHGRREKAVVGINITFTSDRGKVIVSSKLASPDKETDEAVGEVDSEDQVQIPLDGDAEKRRKPRKKSSR